MTPTRDPTRRTFDDIQVSLDDHVACVEIQRPPHNFFDTHMIGQIADAFESLDEHPDCRSIVLAAQGKNFCAGADFSADEQDSDFSVQGFHTRTQLLYRAGVRLFRCRKPVVAAIQGSATGGGLGLALVADFRVVTAGSRLTANFVKLGIHQGFGLSVTLPRLIGMQQASNMLLTGRRVKGKEALAMGLADMLVDDDRVRKAALELADEIAANAPLAVASVRATLRRGLADEIERITEHELKEQQWLRETRDAEEGIAAVAQRRAGNFQGQ